MLVEPFAKAVKKLANFAWEDGPSHIYSNVRFQGDEHYINMFCSNGSCGMWQRIKQGDKPVIGECCVDVFWLNKIFGEMDQSSEVDITFPGTDIRIKNKRLDLKHGTMNIDQSVTIPKGKDFTTLNPEFIQELKSVIPTSLAGNAQDENPIVFNGKQLFYANPRSLIYIATDKFTGDLCFEQKYVNKLFLDDFTLVSRLEGLTYFQNDDCEIFLPYFNGKMLKIDPIVNKIKNDYNIECRVAVKELLDISNMVYKLLESGKDFDNKIRFKVNKNQFEFDFYGNTFQVFDYTLDSELQFEINVPLNHLKMITRKSFTSDSKYIKLRFSTSTEIFASSNNDLLFAGGLYRT